MRRREFITLLGSGAASWPLATRAQDAGPPVIGLLQMGTPSAYDLSGFRQGLLSAKRLDLFHRVVPKAAGFRCAVWEKRRRTVCEPRLAIDI